MDSAHIDHDRRERRKPRYFYHTPFSYLAFLLALLMIVPMSGRIRLVPDARADTVAGNGCEQICTPFCITGPDNETHCGGELCQADPNDPDCDLTPTGTCTCKDGTFFNIQGFPDATTCNTSATCLNHGGFCEPFDFLCFGTGGGGDGGILIGGCGLLKFFNGGTVCSADVRAFDPDTGAVLVNESVFAGPQLDALERQAIDDVLTLHGLPAADKNRLLAWGRDRVRAQLFAKLVNIIEKPATARTGDEQVLYNWLTNIVWQKRIVPTQKAWEQYLAWKNAVDFATCSWQPPGQVVWQPKWLIAANDPQKIDCQADFTPSGGPTFQRLCQLNGCSPGNDGIPRTDPTPNSPGDPPNPADDGEICFASGSFSYDLCTEQRCNGVPSSIECLVALPGHPTYEQFKGYGAALANKQFVYHPSFLSIAGNTSKAAAFGIGVGIAAIAAGVGTAAASSAGLLASFAKAVFPFAVRAGTAVAVAAVGAASAIFVVVLAVITIIIGSITLAEFEQLDDNLKADIRTAASTTNTAQGKPNLATLIATATGRQEIFFAFIETVGPEIDLSGRTAPAPENEPLWAIMDQNRTPLRTESGQLLTFTSWDNRIGKTGLFGGWFVPQLTQSGGTTQNTLALGIEYVTPNGEQRTAWRTKCQDQTNAACTFGQALFVHTRNGDEPPTNLGEAEFAAWFANVSTEITHKNSAGASRIARLNRRPTATGFMVSGTAEEGQQFTLHGSGSDPDGDGVSLVWDFNDGTGTVTGSPVEHTFADSGTFTVTMTPTDMFGATGPARNFPVTIANLPPTATFATPVPTNEGSPIMLSLTNPSDPSPADTAAGFQYAFNCGSSFGDFGSSSSVSCPTTDNGNIAVAGKIKDKDSGVSEYSATATVTNVAPTATFTATPQIFLGESSMLAFSEQSDPSPVDVQAGFTYAYDCTTNGTLSVTNNRAATATCRYLTTGTFTVGGTISDKDQDATSYTASVTVISPQQAAINLRAQVVALNLDARRTSDLTTKIENALQKLAEGKKDEAQKQLRDFIKKVDDIVQQKLITAAQGQALKDVATRVIASIAVS